MKCSRAPIHELNFLRAPHCFLLATCLSYSSTLKMEAVRSLKISEYFYGTTRRHTTEDCTPHLYENLKPKTLLLSSLFLFGPSSDRFTNDFLVKIKFTLLASSKILLYIYLKIKSIWNWSQNLHLQSREMHEIGASALAERLDGWAAWNTRRQKKRGTRGLQSFYKRPCSLQNQSVNNSVKK
jgi:hypothetical protein